MRAFKRGNMVKHREAEWTAFVLDTDLDGRGILLQQPEHPHKSWYANLDDFVVIGSIDLDPPVLTETTIYNPLDDMVGGSHYKDGKLQPMEFAAMHEYTPPQYTAFKYVHRHRNKNGAQDVAKAIHCLHLLLKIEYDMTYEEARQQPHKKKEDE